MEFNIIVNELIIRLRKMIDLSVYSIFNDKFNVIVQPAILPIQILRVGKLIILSVPGGLFSLTC